MTAKRFTSYKKDGKIIGFVDNVTKTHHSSFLSAKWKMNDLWEQTQRFEKHNQRLIEENMELKERNNRQYEQLNQLYHLIEAEDWETLTKLNNELKENEKQLQREWKCY